MINIEDVSFDYQQIKIINNLSMTINKGDFLCIIGENGTGKTTLIKGLVGLKHPTSGTICFNHGLKQNEIGYLPQQNAIQKEFPASVFEIVLSGCLNQKKSSFFYNKEVKQKANRILIKLKIEDLKNKSYQELSGGQRQRVLLARALLATSKVLVLDEPTSALDPVASLEFYQLLKEINQEQQITILMVSHDVNEMTAYASHILLLLQDKTYHLYTTDQFLKEKGEHICRSS